jgi:DNA-binding beta-propeller fold protein YncE
MKKAISVIVCSVLIACGVSTFAQTDSTKYKIVNKFKLEGDGSWDYLTSDDSTGRLYISHGTIVQVIDSKTGKLIGTITGLNGVHGIALAKELNKGFISSGKDSSVTVFDLKTLTTITKINVTGKNPDAILYESTTQKVFVYNGRTANATVIDAKTNTVAGTIALDGKPEFSVYDGKGNVYVNIEDKSEISVINAKTLKVEKTWSVKPGEEPSGLAIDTVNHILFSVCDNKLMVVIDAETGKVITTLPIGENVDGVAFDPSLKRAYSSNGDGTLTVVQEESKSKFSVLCNVKTQKGARTITINKMTHHLYLPTAEFGETPAATKEKPHPRPAILPNTFIILDIVPVK